MIIFMRPQNGCTSLRPWLTYQSIASLPICACSSPRCLMWAGIFAPLWISPWRSSYSLMALDSVPTLSRRSTPAFLFLIHQPSDPATFS